LRASSLFGPEQHENVFKILVVGTPGTRAGLSLRDCSVQGQGQINRFIWQIPEEERFTYPRGALAAEFLEDATICNALEL
jgi:hypothetical protein